MMSFLENNNEEEGVSSPKKRRIVKQESKEIRDRKRKAKSVI